MSTLKAVDLQHPSAAAANISLASSGNVGIGTGSPTRPLTISAASASASITSTTGTNAVNFNFNNTGGLFSVGIDNSTGTGFGAGAYGRVLYSDGAYPLVMYTNATERMRIDSSGNVGIGTSSVFSGARLDIVGSGTQRLYIRETGSSVYGKMVASTTVVGIGSETNHPLLFNTNDVERARFDSSGNFIVGSTSAIGKVNFYAAGAGQIALYLNNPNASSTATPALYCVKFDNVNTTSQVYAQFAYNAGAAGGGQINGNGANQAAFGGFSDVRLKENVVNLPPQLESICSLRPVEFDFKDGSGHQIGFIAQEMQEVYPDVVGAGADDMLTITGWSKTEARLVAAIQELKAQNDALKARVATLEAK